MGMRLSIWAAVLASLLGVMACRNGGVPRAVEIGTGPVRVATSISVFADMVQQVGGERVTVLALVPPGADAHTFQPAPRDVKRLQGVRAVFLNGARLEEGLENLIRNNVPASARVVRLSQGLQPIEFTLEPVGPVSRTQRTAGEEDEDEGVNPHFWLDIANAKRYVERIRDTLAEVDADGRDTYATNAERYLKELDEVDAYIKEQIATIPPAQRKLVTFHDAFPYFAKAYGLEIAGFVIRAPGREPSAQDIKELGDIIRRQKVKTVFIEPQFNARVLEQAAKDAGVRVDVLHSDALTKDITSYTAMMRRNAETIARGLR